MVWWWWWWWWWRSKLWYQNGYYTYWIIRWYWRCQSHGMTIYKTLTPGKFRLITWMSVFVCWCDCWKEIYISQFLLRHCPSTIKRWELNDASLIISVELELLNCSPNKELINITLSVYHLSPRVLQISCREN